MAADGYIQSETMQFRDNVPGSMDERGAVMDPTRGLSLIDDASLGAWFSRPVQIADLQWDVDSNIFERFNPWTLFWENDRNIEKIKNFHLLQAKLHVKFLINGNAFYYGRALAAYEPLAPLDNTSPKREWVQEDFIRGSQRMKIFLNPTMSAGGSLELPFFWPKNNWVIPNNDWRSMGEIVLASFQDLKHANGGTDPLNITVLAWAEDVKFAIPTRAVPQSPIPEAGPPDEHESDVISRPATNVARVAGSLADVPIIGKYAKATEMGAKAVASTAKMFGLSAPNDLHQSLFEPRSKHSIAVTDTKQSANKVTVDSKQELTIDARTTGIGPTDELPIASIAGRESYLTTFQWPVAGASGDHLFNSRVDPGLKGRNGDEWHFPACALAALPFQYWRGTMRFRFQIVASEYHKGRLRVSYDPRLGGLTSEFNTHYTTVHDIAENKDFTVDVGWGQNVPYRESLGWYSGPEYGFIPLTTNIAQGNGVLSVYVLNKLAAPTNDNSDVSVNVFVSMLDDFEVAAPDDKISYLRHRPGVAVPEPDSYTNFMNGLKLGNTKKKFATPEAGPVPDDADDQDAPITDPESIDEIAKTQMDTPDTTMVFMGEVITSFRTLLKRGYKSETRLMIEPDSTSAYKLSRGSFPTYGGFIEGQTIPVNSMVTTFGDGRTYNTSLTTLLNYLGRSFLGWRGSTRWTVDAGSLNLSSTRQGGDGSDVWNSVTYALSRRNEYAYNQQVSETTGVLISNIPQVFNEIERGVDSNGAYLANTGVNPIQTVEVPYLLTDRFSYTFLEENYEDTTKGPGWECSMLLPRSESIFVTSFLKLYVSTGEDFNFFFFNGTPPVYYEPDFGRDQSG